MTPFCMLIQEKRVEAANVTESLRFVLFRIHDKWIYSICKEKRIMWLKLGGIDGIHLC